VELLRSGVHVYLVYGIFLRRIVAFPSPRTESENTLTFCLNSEMMFLAGECLPSVLWPNSHWGWVDDPPATASQSQSIVPRVAYTTTLSPGCTRSHEEEELCPQQPYLPDRQDDTNSSAVTSSASLVRCSGASFSEPTTSLTNQEKELVSQTREPGEPELLSCKEY
jgi:hypothetical protein